jgi:hypothetical protein
VLSWRFGWRPVEPDIAMAGDLRPAGTPLTAPNIYAP